MALFIKNRTHVKGLAPGSLVLIGEQRLDKPMIHTIRYNATEIVEKQPQSIEEAINERASHCVLWINVYGIHDKELFNTIGEQLNLSTLLLEDMMNTDQRPKYEHGDHYSAFILKLLKKNKNGTDISTDQVSILLTKDIVLTLQEQKTESFEAVRKRIRGGVGRIRKSGCDYLAYAIMDSIADHYSIFTEELGSRVEEMEERIFDANYDRALSKEIYKHKLELNVLRKAVRPVRDITSILIKGHDPLFKNDTINYVKDLGELIDQSADTIEIYNALVADQLNIYNTNVSNRMNEVMKVLTIFASIFIPLTFLAGIYGMNFQYMPELNYKYGYPVLLSVMLLVTLGLLWYFRRKRWL